MCKWMDFLYGNTFYALSPNISQLDTLQAQLATGIQGNDHTEASSNLDLCRRRGCLVPVMDPLSQRWCSKKVRVDRQESWLRDCDLIKVQSFASWIFFGGTRCPGAWQLVDWCLIVSVSNGLIDSAFFSSRWGFSEHRCSGRDPGSTFADLVSWRAADWKD